MVKKEEVKIVKVQRMFPNCEKYKTMKKVKKIHNYKEMIDDMLESVKEKQ